MFVLPHPGIPSGPQCFVSIPTVQTVSSCPKTEAELSHAKQRKKCEHLANIQLCTKRENFTYHCVLNALSTENIEVCAPEMFSQGYCLYFDEVGALLQENYEIDCTGYTNPCKTRFLSSDLLHYSQCNEIARKSKSLVNMTITTKRLLNKLDDVGGKGIVYYTSVIGIAVLVAFNCIGHIIAFLYMNFNKMKGNRIKI